MGYTHYWSTESDIAADAVWNRIKAAARSICANSNVVTKADTGLERFDWKHIDINGVDDDAHETFLFERSAHSSFCKTARKPYDIVVAAILIYAKYELGDKLTLHSDGDFDDAEWQAALRLCKLATELPTYRDLHEDASGFYVA